MKTKNTLNYVNYRKNVCAELYFVYKYSHSILKNTATPMLDGNTHNFWQNELSLLLSIDIVFISGSELEKRSMNVLK